MRSWTRHKKVPRFTRAGRWFHLQERYPVTVHRTRKTWKTHRIAYATLLARLLEDPTTGAGLLVVTKHL